MLHDVYPCMCVLLFCCFNSHLLENTLQIQSKWERGKVDKLLLPGIVFLANLINFGLVSSHLACDEERVDEAKLLVSHGASIYIENKEEKTPLQIAKGGLGSILRRLVEG